MLAPLKPREANSATAAARMRARLAFGALGLRMAVVREDKSCVAMLTSELADLQVEFNRLAKSTQRSTTARCCGQNARGLALPNVREAAPFCTATQCGKSPSVAAPRLY